MCLPCRLPRLIRLKRFARIVRMIVVRIGLAYVIGISLYMIAAVLDVLAPIGGIEAIIGLPIQFVMGSILIGALIAIVFIAGAPLRVSFLQKWVTARLVICALCVLGGAMAVVLSRLPAYMVSIPHPELGLPTKIRVGNPTLSLAGLAAMLFGIVNAWIPDRQATQAGVGEG